MDTNTNGARFVSLSDLVRTAEGDLTVADWADRTAKLQAAYLESREDVKRMSKAQNQVIAERDTLKRDLVIARRRIVELGQPVVPAPIVKSDVAAAAEPAMIGGWLAIQDPDLPAGSVAIVPDTAPEAAKVPGRWRRFVNAHTCAKCGLVCLNRAQVRANKLDSGPNIDGEPMYQPTADYTSSVCAACAVKHYAQPGVPPEMAAISNAIGQYRLKNAGVIDGPVKVTANGKVTETAKGAMVTETFTAPAPLTNSPVAADRVARIKAVMATGFTLAEAMEVVKAGLDN